jgi:hypothetical protein
VHLLAAGIPLTIAGGTSVIAAIGVIVSHANSSDPCQHDITGTCREHTMVLVLTLGLGGFLALGAGVRLDAIGGSRRFVDPQGEPIPERGEAKGAPKLTVRARLGVGWTGLEGAF